MFSRITSLQHPLIKHLVKLRESRDYRYHSQTVVLCGLKLITELAPRFTFRCVLLDETFDPGFELNSESLYRVSPEIIKKVSGLKNPEPIVAEIQMPKAQDLSSVNFLLILDGISDPGNLGTLLRSAWGLGWDGVFLTPRTVDPFNDKAVRAAKGATFHLPWKTGNYEELNALLTQKKMKLYAADARGATFRKDQFSPPLALAVGNEAHGLAAELKKNARMIAIPMKSGVESLNVSSAGAILMYNMKVL